MSNQGVDTASLVNFKPPKFFCPQCYGLISDLDAFGWTKSEDGKHRIATCPVCTTEFWAKARLNPSQAETVFAQQLFNTFAKK